jgi:GTPase Era involved in 16S rRNA processing
MSSRSVQNPIIGLGSFVKGFITVQHQRLTVSRTPASQELLDISNMIKVLVIGETGSGKSTFINYLANYFKNGTLNNLKIAIPSVFHPQVTEKFKHHEHDVQDKTQSKTDSCNQYMFTDGTSQYLFLDTPGLSDTRGPGQDKINLDKIIDAVENLCGLTAVIIVVNGTIARLTVNLQNVIAQLRGNLPDIVMDNVIVVSTNGTRHTVNFPLEELKVNGNVYPYYMQNSAFSTDPAKWTPAVMQSLQADWDQVMDELKAMMATLKLFTTKSVSAFKNMKDIRNEIKALMHAARLEVSEIQRMQDEIAMFETGLKQANADTIAYKDYTKQQIVDKVELVDAPYHSTLCKNCNHVCHDKCGLDESTVAGAQIFQQCWAMEDGNCTKCQHKCSYTAHYHAKKTIKVSKQTLNDVLADIKSRYDAASNNSTNFQKKIRTVADAKRLLEKALQQKNAEIIAKCNHLRQICSGFNLASELNALIHQLEV